MNRLGYRVTVIEVANELRKGGTPVDIEGETIGILARMGILDAVRAKALAPRAFEFKDADDRTVRALGDDTASDHGEREIRDTPARPVGFLFASVEGTAEVVFGGSITQLEEGPDDVDYRDRAQQRLMVHDHFEGLGWKLPRP